MSTSEHGYRVAFPASRLSGAEDLSPFALKTIANNAHHYADEKCNHLVNWVAPRQSVMTTGAGYIEQSPSETEWRHLTKHGPFPITLHGSGGGYRMRLRLAGAAQAGSIASFAAILVPFGGNPIVWPDNVSQGYGARYFTSSTTPAWLTPAAGTELFIPHPSLVTPSLRAVSTFTDTGGDPVTVDITQIELWIFAKSNVVDVAGRLYGVHFSEYVGP